MKRNDKQKLHQSSVAELHKQLDQLQLEQIKTRNELKLGKLNNTKVARNMRGQIAIIKTIIQQKELQAKLETQS